jgi:hypothetical protein
MSLGTDRILLATAADVSWDRQVMVRTRTRPPDGEAAAPILTPGSTRQRSWPIDRVAPTIKRRVDATAGSDGVGADRVGQQGDVVLIGGVVRQAREPPAVPIADALIDVHAVDAAASSVSMRPLGQRGESAASA